MARKYEGFYAKLLSLAGEDAKGIDDVKFIKPRPPNTVHYSINIPCELADELKVYGIDLHKTILNCLEDVLNYEKEKLHGGTNE